MQLTLSGDSQYHVREYFDYLLVINCNPGLAKSPSLRQHNLHLTHNLHRKFWHLALLNDVMTTVRNTPITRPVLGCDIFVTVNTADRHIN